MMRNLLVTISLLFLATLAFGQTAVAGKVIDSETKEGLIGANVVFYKNGNLITGAATDFDGNYKINLDPGTYDVKASYTGMNEKEILGVLVKKDQTTSLPIELSSGVLLESIEVVDYKVPLIDKDNTTSGQTITGKDIRNLPTKNITALASTAAGLSQVDEGDAVTVRGSRADAVDYYIDGIRVSGGGGGLVPESEIEQLQVITGGIAAKYGDVTGGIISITTKGPSSAFGGNVEVETSQFLDDFGYNMVSANFTGPIIKKKGSDGIERSVLGYRFSGRYRYQLDDDPPATDIYKVKEDRLKELEANPVSILNGTISPTAHTYDNDDVDVLGYRPNEETSRLDLTAKIDAQLTDNIDISFGGTFYTNKDKFTPRNGGRDYWQVYNSHNNPTDNLTRYRGNFRFRHRLGEQAGGSEEGSSSLIQNAFYTLQAGYEKTLRKLGDTRHDDNFFAYGYIGKFDFDYLPFIGATTEATLDPNAVTSVIPGDVNTYGHVGFTQVFRGYEANTQYNPVLANYNNVLAGDDLLNYNAFIARNGIINQGLSSVWTQMHANVGTVYNLYRKNNNDRITFNASSSFDLVPGGSEGTRHSIEFGLSYEQRYNRSYSLNPRSLWVLAEQSANEHFLGVDYNNPIGVMDFNNALTTIPRDLLTGDITQYPILIDNANTNTFYKRVREVAGVNLDQFVNVHSLTPDQLSIDMFTARKLMDRGIVGYYGYDYKGNELPNTVTFDDFFTSRDANGNRDFPVAAFQPNYFAGYIQDKFSINDITFRVGVRVDRYDANTKVMKDPYSLYEIMGAKDYYAGDVRGERPATIGDDFKVYVVDGDNRTVTGFRNGDQWYDASGTAVENVRTIAGDDVFLKPRLVDENARITSEDFNPSTSFEDYKPQVNIMPRLAFSFPISDKANFFAHYDVLVQRPQSSNIATALDYFYFPQDAPRNNPNLKPEKTVDYEVGFRQAVSDKAAVKIAIYYKELRDMIQTRFYQNTAPIVSYESYDNIDFGTVKGFTFQYDLRKGASSNVSANLNYTLQFADGTGSSPESNRQLSRRTNVRTLIPLSFDERHRFTASIDYRYGRGKGPTILGKKLLENFGVNLQGIMVSGRPYTANTTPERFSSGQLVGTFNGARKPWNFTVNLRVDKNITLSKSEKFPLDMNVYLRVSNLFNTQNIIDLYKATGSATSDGFLTTNIGQASLNSPLVQANLDSYLASYQWAETNPGFFSLPRRIYIGAIFDF